MLQRDTAPAAPDPIPGSQASPPQSTRALLPELRLAGLTASPDPDATRTLFLGDTNLTLPLTHQQQWGEFGKNTAAAAVGRPGSPMRIGDQTFRQGLGHHANGEITIQLDGQFSEFRADIGVQWQGGGKGSVVFRVEVDERTVFESPVMSDSDPAKAVSVPVSGARQLRLIASDAGDGIGCDMANWADARLIRQEGVPFVGPLQTILAGRRDARPSDDFCGLSLIACESGPQVLVAPCSGWFCVDLLRDETAQLAVPLRVDKPLTLSARATVAGQGSGEVELCAGGQSVRRTLMAGESVTLRVSLSRPGETELMLTSRAARTATRIDWSEITYELDGHAARIPLVLPHREPTYPPPRLPPLRGQLESVLVEWDWRMQDGIGTDRYPQSPLSAVTSLFERGDELLALLQRESPASPALVARWQQLKNLHERLARADADDEAALRLWREVHEVRRQIMLEIPGLTTTPILFAKRVPSCFSHQLTQYYGMCARPGGGIFVLEEPGKSMRCRPLTDLPPGSYQHPELSWDGSRVLFSYCQADSAPVSRAAHQDRHYHLYEVQLDGNRLRQLTAGDFDDFSPRYLADDRLLFVSTRRGGFHRCGAGPCPVYTLTTANADGSDPRPISYHETHEWDPALLSDGRIIYTRWDYVDRHAVHYQQLWACRPDGSNVTAYYGNNTFNPVGVWEARPVPGSNLVMATAAAHHAMTAGSIILVDVARGIDGLQPLERLTPDALFPESEAPVQRWHALAGHNAELEVPVEARRWSGHCYRSPYPLTEEYFLAAYSFEPLIGEPHANRANMFGIYLVDRFGNKELLYRDLNIGSLWPTPIRPRPRPPVLPPCATDPAMTEGTFFLQNVYDSWPQLPGGQQDRVTHLRIVQVLPKTTPHINTPRVGLANASPGKQVLGTVPVEEDGSAYFRAPAKVALAFQALDARGMALQTMRSLTYLQPGEQTSCVGCHEHRASTPQPLDAMALARPPSEITPGPDGTHPLSYPILVQEVLDKHCVECHGRDEPAGGIILTGQPQGEFSASYLALAPLVSFSQWQGTPQDNHEPLTAPNQFGARASKLTKLLSEGHEGVTLSDEDWQRLITWMDANALFYGTFNPDDQARQLRGERIAGPELE